MQTATRAEGATITATEERLSLLEQMLEEQDLSRQAEQRVHIDRLSISDSGVAQLERRTQMLEALYIAGLRATRPEDWVLTSDKQGTVTGMLTGPGADRVADIYGIQITGIRPLDGGKFRPEREPLAHGHYVLRAWCDAESTVTKRQLFALQAARRSDEEFTGRGVTAEGGLTTASADKVSANPTDLEAAVYTLLKTKAVRVLASMTRVPQSDLERAWKDSPKKVSACRKGHGFGTGNDRRISQVAEADVPAEVAKLKAELTRITGGDVSMAKKITKEITANGSFAGFDSLDRIAKPFQVDQAWNGLKKHPLYAPPAAAREAGQEG